MESFDSLYISDQGEIFTLGALYTNWKHGIEDFPIKDLISFDDWLDQVTGDEFFKVIDIDLDSEAKDMQRVAESRFEVSFEHNTDKER